MPVTASTLAIVGAAIPRSLTTPGLLAVVGIAVVVTLLLYAEHPQLSRRAVISLVPWMVVGAGLSVLAAARDYPPLVEPVVSGVGAYVTTYAVVCGLWFVILQLARGSRRGGGLPAYLGAMGVGAATVVVSVLLLSAGNVSGNQLFWLAIAPIASAAVAGIVLLLLGLWYTEAAAYTGMVGGLVIFGHSLSAIATAVAVVAGASGHTQLSWTVLNLLSTAGAAARMGLDQQLLWAWGFVWTKLMLATLVVVALTAFTSRHPERGNLVLGSVGAVGVVGGVTVLLSMAVGM